MSDPVTNVEVEDVLSSIRRLLADSQPDSPAPGDSQAEEKLVLTAEFRVREEAEAEPSTPLVLETPLAPEPELVEPTPVDEPEAAEAAETAEPASTAEDAALDQAASEADAPIHEDAAPDAEASTDALDPDSLTERRARLEATIAELEAAVAGADTDWEPDGSEDVEEAQFIMPSTLARDLSAVEDADVSDEEVSDEPAAQVDASPEPEDASDDEAEEIPFVEEAPGAATLAPDAGHDELAAFLAEGAAIDDDKLQAMVAEAVRAELQGVLGERITRNVRKLVRREIYRIIASEDLT